MDGSAAQSAGATTTAASSSGSSLNGAGASAAGKGDHPTILPSTPPGVSQVESLDMPEITTRVKPNLPDTDNVISPIAFQRPNETGNK